MADANSRYAQTLEEELESLEKTDPKVKAAAEGLRNVTKRFSPDLSLFGPNYFLPIGEWKFEEPVEVDLSHPLIQKVLSE